jgi:UrcA family protein
MNTETHLPHRPIGPQSSKRTGAMVALLALTSAIALADQPPQRIAEIRAAKVSLAGLDLSTPEGARAARDRIKIVAERLCFQMSDPSLIDNQATYNVCVLESLAATVRRINAPTVTALKK